MKCLIVYNLSLSPIFRYPLGPREYKHWKRGKPRRNKNWGDPNPGPDGRYGDCSNPSLCEHAGSSCGPRHIACHPSPLPEAHQGPQIRHDVCRAEEYTNDLEFDPELRLQWLYPPSHPSIKTHHWGSMHSSSYYGKGQYFWCLMLIFTSCLCSRFFFFMFLILQWDTVMGV